MRFQTLQTPVGDIIVTADDRAIHHVYYSDKIDLDELQRRVGGSLYDEPHPLLERAVEQLQEYFAAKRQQFDLPLAPAGTPFQQSVWSALQQIQYGATWSYLELAELLNKPTATRAVGSANGQNPISIIIPCHRVIGKNGTLTGYGGGVERKAWLLELERNNSGNAFTQALF